MRTHHTLPALAVSATLLGACATTCAADTSPPAPSTPVGQAPKPANRPVAPAQIFAEPTVLTPRGTLVIEPDVQYVHSTNNQVALLGYTVLPALTIGLIDIQRIESNLSTFSLTARYGLLSRLELDIRVPYVLENTATQTRPLATAAVTNSFFNSAGNGLGDVEVALRTQLNAFRGNNMVWIASLRLKSRTGTSIFQEPIDPASGLQTRLATGSGFYAVQPGITFLMPSDPAVFFGGAAYTYSIGRNVGHGYGYIHPGGIIDLTLGMGLTLNERASFSIGYQQSIVNPTGQTTPASGLALAQVGTLQLGTLRFGVTYQVNPKTLLNVTIGIGVTRDTPDLEATMRLPVTF